MWWVVAYGELGAGIGLLFGGGIACYANSFLLTDVVRALILFYITPVWTTIFEMIFLRQLPKYYRYVTLILALSGVWIVFGQNGVFQYHKILVIGLHFLEGS